MILKKKFLKEKREGEAMNLNIGGPLQLQVPTLSQNPATALDQPLLSFQ